MLGLTATVGGASTLEASIERIIRLEDTQCCRIVHQESQEELDQFTSKAAEATVSIQLSVSEVWLLNLLKELLSHLDQSSSMVGSAGIARALSYLARSFVNIKKSYQVPDGLVHKLGFKMMFSKLFSPVSEIFGDEHSIATSSDGFFLHEPTSTQRELVKCLAQLASTLSFRAILFFKTVCGLNTTLLLLQDGGGARSCDAEFDSQLEALRREVRPLKLLGIQHMTHADQMEHVQRFRDGGCNLLLCTSVGEEGLDFPACNAVVCVDAVVSDTSLVQCRGRARAANGRFLVFVQEFPDSRSLPKRLADRSVLRESNATLALQHYVSSPDSWASHSGSRSLGREWHSAGAVTQPRQSDYPAAALAFGSPGAGP